MSACALCDRTGAELTVHHLVPRDLEGTHGPTADLCRTCHDQVHVLYSNRRLASELHTVEALREEPAMKAFLRWVRKQDPRRRFPVRPGSHRRRR